MLKGQAWVLGRPGLHFGSVWYRQASSFRSNGSSTSNARSVGRASGCIHGISSPRPSMEADRWRERPVEIWRSVAVVASTRHGVSVSHTTLNRLCSRCGVSDGDRTGARRIQRPARLLSTRYSRYKTARCCMGRSVIFSQVRTVQSPIRRKRTN